MGGGGGGGGGFGQNLCQIACEHPEMRKIFKIFCQQQLALSTWAASKDQNPATTSILYLYLLNLYPGFYSYTEGATWKILDLFMETLLI